MWWTGDGTRERYGRQVPRATHHYGKERAQVGDLWRPGGRSGDLPVVVLVHGGYWRSVYPRIVMNRMARAIAAEGWLAWNIEYRRMGPLGGGGGWPHTFVDVALAIDYLTGIKGVDLDRVIICGHSAGAELAFWAAAKSQHGGPPDQPALPIRAAISLAGLLDLERVRSSGNRPDRVADFLGGSPGRVPDRYRRVSPARMLPLMVPQVLLHGLADRTIPATWSEDYQRSARAAGDDATYIPIPGVGHRSIIAGTGSSWNSLAGELSRWLN
jgi:acetyl esterase/lipase